MHIYCPMCDKKHMNKKTAGQCLQSAYFSNYAAVVTNRKDIKAKETYHEMKDYVETLPMPKLKG